jgi:hypothetical protein
VRTKISRRVVALALGVGSIGLGSVAVATSVGAPAFAAGSCDNDHVTPGTGNGGDPGNGGSHHNESNGNGNLGDPGNGANHQCQ